MARLLSVSILCFIVLGDIAPAQSALGEIRFGRDVLPILSDRCFHCHGPDEGNRKADLRLDLRESAVDLHEGIAAIVPGNPDESEFIARITADDETLLMPPPSSHRAKLTEREVDILSRWVAAGAPWGKHWAFERPVRAADSKGINPIDFYVERKLKQEGLDFSLPAEKATLLRRLSWDLNGLPPTPEELNSFLNDTSPDAVTKVVERLLASPHYGERMAMWWLDAARYSDTDGYQGDATRTNWPWRDWVIEAFNRNLRYDQFTIEQFAGDLLPDATPEQVVATCFHRNHMTNGEGGRDPEESRIDYVIDRVNTTGTVWLGLTLGCTQCHSHKFDPVSQQDYYRLFAFFDSIDETGAAGGGATPYFSYKSPHAPRAVEETKKVVEFWTTREAEARKQAEEQILAGLQSASEIPSEYFIEWEPLAELSVQSQEGTLLTQEADSVIQASGPNPFQDDYRIVGQPRQELAQRGITGFRVEVFPHESHTGGKFSRGATGEFILTDVKLQVRTRGKSLLRDVLLTSAVADAESDARAREYGKAADTLDDDPRNGWTTKGAYPWSSHQMIVALSEPLVLQDDEELILVLLQRSTAGDSNLGRFRITLTSQRGEAVRKIDAMPLREVAAYFREAEQRGVSFSESIQKLPDPLKKTLVTQLLIDDREYQAVRKQLELANQQLSELNSAAGDLKVMVLGERKESRKTHVLERGVWDKKGAEVQRGLLNTMLETPAETPRTRLDLARWLISAQNPLTARVTVNHLWQLYFGAGLVRTPEDFGLQGQQPTHPELLDTLALELIEHDWDLHHIIRLIVTSRTYQQSSHVSETLLDRDPENRLLARSPRYRLPAWMIRDGALQASGLLNPTVGGPPVRPYQPPGVWEELFMGRYTYLPSLGPAQYRRTVYAFWRRSSAPTFLFDSAQRRVCEVRQNRTNTPLQALTLLNDESILDASKAIAKLAVEASSDDESRLQFLAHRILSRNLASEEIVRLTELRKKAVVEFQEQSADSEFLKVGQMSFKHDSEPAAALPEQASYMLVASLLFNLDEAVTRE